MAKRVFAIGDIHGDLEALHTLLDRLPELTSDDRLVFVGDYIDRGPDSKGVVDFLMNLHETCPAELIFLRGNHEDGWLRVLDEGFPGFVLPPQNGCLQVMESYLGREVSEPGATPDPKDLEALLTGSFFPDEVVAWMRDLKWWYEDEFAIYVHAGLPRVDGEFLHPSKAEGAIRTATVWKRDETFFREYRGKPVVVGHTITTMLPPELSDYTPDDPDDLWAGDSVMAIDTGCGKGGFLTAVEMPGMLVYESR